MMGKQNQTEPKLFYHGVSLNRRLPQDHPLRRIDQLVDFDFIRSKVADLYGTVGNPSVDPAVILRLMFLTYYENVNSERALMSQLPLRLDWLWFCGYDIDDPTPDHSVISKARRRWGEDVFVEFFAPRIDVLCFYTTFSTSGTWPLVILFSTMNPTEFYILLAILGTYV